LDKIKCKILFNDNPGNTHLSQVLAGYKLLENQEILKIDCIKPYREFRSSGMYEHNGIAEVCFGDKILAYDLADGYQSIHRKDVFDNQMNRLDFYFKRSYNPSFHKDMKNKNKVKALGLNYLCTCKGNPYDRFFFNSLKPSEFRRLAAHVHIGDRDKFFFEQFESNEKKYNDYKLLFLTRIWNSEGTNAKNIKKTYPYLSDIQAEEEAKRWKNSLDSATESRIEYVKALREHFGDKVIAGISRSDFSEKVCPDLIVSDDFTERNNYLRMIKENYICITSEGLHNSIGWKFAEYVAAGKAIITEPLFYEVPFSFTENQNYLVYNDVDSLINKCEYLLNNVSAIHQMESNNRNYYSEHVRPDMLVLDTLKTAQIL